ncbi:acyl carrier protein [Marivirga sp. S37H4]|uniref:Acyl carrier protein n=1 Tax=Marivirga aurantiaca TaxID=2802615 RepID=A0A935C6C6_9BACT|nr:acyl carrier protein [Marivirga aurantiaca]MBK6264294.1 acyl carrier protein [Marivirga aurantiaca]
MKNISNFKKIIRVFQQYGIVLTGKRKSANFYSGLHMERIFVEGLIFELEYSLNKELEESKVGSVETPEQLINYFVIK